MTKTSDYIVGGAVPPESDLYIPRQADEDLLALCRQGTFAYLLAARQMGKSSLMFRTARTLADETTRCVLIDLNEIGTELTAEQWYFGILTKIKQELTLQADVFAWWQAHTHLGVAQRLTLFFKEILLAEVSVPVVIFVDEVDSTLSLDFSDDFFAAIRYLYNARVQMPEFQRLSFVLIGVATPNDLISNPKRTPFNIGQQVDLSDFTFQEARPFADGLDLPHSQALQLLAWVLNWTNGHPYLTQRLCQEIVDRHQYNWSEAEVYRLVKEIFLSETKGQDTNLQFVRDMLIRRTPDLAETINLYRAIRSGLYPVPDEERSPVIAHLKLSGIVRREEGVLRVRNPVYAKVFDLSWIEEVEAIEEVGDQREVRRLRALAEAQKRQAEEEKQRAEAERQRAEAERQRAIEQAQAAARLRRRAMWLVGALVAVVVAVVAAAVFGIAAQNAAKQEATARAMEAIAREEAVANLVTAQFNATQEAIARAEADANLVTAQMRATQEAIAREEADSNLATAQVRATMEAIARGEADANLATAEYRATQEGIARGEADANLATAQVRATQEAIARGEADANLSTAEFRATQEAIARGEAETNLATAEYRATQEAIAKEEADANLATAQVRATQEAQARGTAEAESTRAFEEQKRAEEAATRSFENQQTAVAERNQARLAISRQLATQAQDYLTTDVGIALLLSLQANHITETLESRNSLTDSLQSLPRLTTLDNTDSGHIDNALSVAFSPDGKILASGSADNTIILWDVSDRLHPQRLGVLSGHEADVVSVAFSPVVTQQILASGSVDENGTDNAIILWDVANQTQLFRITRPHSESVRSVAFSSDGKMLASGSDDDTIRLWKVADPKNPQQAGVITGHEHAVWSVAFSPVVTQILASGGFDKKIILWDVANPDNPKKIDDITAPGEVVSVVFSPDGKTLASGGAKRTISLWNISSQEKTELSDINGIIWSIAFSKDGQTLASAGNEDTIVLWEVADWKQLKTLTGHTEKILGIAFNPDEKTLASASDDDKIILWEIGTATPDPPVSDVKKACLIVGRNMTLDEIKQFKLEDILKEFGNTGPCDKYPFPAPATISVPLSIPSPTPTATATPVPTPIPTATATPVLASTPTPTPSPTPTATATPVPSPMAAPLTPTPSPSLTATLAPTPTPSSTATLPPTPVPTLTTIPTSTSMPTLTATVTPTPAATPTPTPTLRTEIPG